MQLQQTEFIVENPKTNVDKSTLPEVYRPLMQGPTMIAGRCFICGRHEPLEQHHYVWRSWGNLYRNGEKMRKPTVTLCGFGNNLIDANGRMYCHGMAHHHLLHFRWTPSGIRTDHAHTYDVTGAGRLEYLVTDVPTDYMDALAMDGWQTVKLLKEE